jgi:hypothetical protein
LNSALLLAQEKPILHPIHLILVHLSSKHYEHHQQIDANVTLKFWRETVAKRTQISHSHLVNQTGDNQEYCNPT